MAPDETRDRRRMEHYRQMLRPESGNTDNEKDQARRNLAELEARYPQPAPSSGFQSGTTYKWDDIFGGFGRATSRESSPFATGEGFSSGGRFYSWSTATGQPPPSGTPFTSGKVYVWGDGNFHETPEPVHPDIDRRADEETKRNEERLRQQRAERERRERERIVRDDHDQIHKIPFWGLSPDLVQLESTTTPWTAEEHARFYNEKTWTYKGPNQTQEAVGKALIAFGIAWSNKDLDDRDRQWIQMETMRMMKTHSITQLGSRWLAMMFAK